MRRSRRRSARAAWRHRSHMGPRVTRGPRTESAFSLSRTLGRAAGGSVPVPCRAPSCNGSRMRRFAIAALLALGVAAAAAAASTFPRFSAASCTRDDFAVKGGNVRAELCRTGFPGGRAVVVLHGCGGFSTFDHRLATELPAYGISTLYV